MSRHRAIVNACIPCQETVVVRAANGSYHRRFVPGKPVYNVNVTLQNEPGVKLGEPVTVIIGPEPETMELGVATVNDVNQFWLDGECLGFRNDLEPGEYRITATRVEE